MDVFKNKIVIQTKKHYSIHIYQYIVLHNKLKDNWNLNETQMNISIKVNKWKLPSVSLAPSSCQLFTNRCY